MRLLAASVLIFSALAAFLSGRALAGAAAPQTVTAGPYEVTLNQSATEIQTMPLVTLTVRKNGTIATDLLPYDGAPGLAEFTNAKTGEVFKTFVSPAGTSVDTQAPTGTATPPAHVGGELEISLPAMPPGTYALKVHLRGSPGTIYTAAFLLEVR